jgi:hypothetical protein
LRATGLAVGVVAVAWGLLTLPDRVARRYGLPVKVVANAPLRVPPGPLIELVVRPGFGAADDWIAEQAGPGDVVVAAQWPAAALAGAKEALVRRRRGLEPARYDHPSLAAVLRSSCGVLLFEDDALGVVEALAGLPTPEADRLRRQLGRPEEAEAAADQFLTLCRGRGVPEPAAQRVLGVLRHLAGEYAFCKSHAVSYGLIAWRAAHLKAHRPVAFWAAALSRTKEGAYPRRVSVEASKRDGVPVLPPCLNRSADAFTQEVGAVHAGLAVVSGLSDPTRAAVLEERRRGGPFGGLADFEQRVSELAPSALAALIRSGCFDYTGRSRGALLREAAVADAPLPRPDEPFPSDWLTGRPLALQWADEWHRLGFLPGPPLMGLLRPCLPAGLADSRTLPALVGKRVLLAGLLATAQDAGGGRRRATLEDEAGLVEAALAAGEPLPSGLGPWLADGTVEARHGVTFLTGARLERARPGLRLEAEAEGPTPDEAAERNGEARAGGQRR